MTISVPNNADLDVEVVFKHDEGVPYSLEAAVDIVAHLRVKATDVAAVLHFSKGEGTIVVVGLPAQGKIRLLRPWTAISHLVGSYEFDVVTIEADGRRRAIYRDQLVFVQGVTR